jgi:hypothetical protein
MPGMKAGDKPIYAAANGWSTASWVEDGRVYTIAVQGEQADVQRYLPSA